MPSTPTVQKQPTNTIPDSVDRFTGAIPSSPSSKDGEQPGQKPSKSLAKAKGTGHVKQP
ncbi:MAG: hypothetical protein Q9174_000352, partial [Haloplaca sp. 1 TL-2023]